MNDSGVFSPLILRFLILRFRYFPNASRTSGFSKMKTPQKHYRTTLKCEMHTRSRNQKHPPCGTCNSKVGSANRTVCRTKSFITFRAQHACRTGNSNLGSCKPMLFHAYISRNSQQVRVAYDFPAPISSCRGGIGEAQGDPPRHSQKHPPQGRSVPERRVRHLSNPQVR